MRIPVLVLAVLVATAPPGSADEAGGATALEQVFSAAGDNADELRSVLAHYAGDARKLEAARFLIENMPGKGHVRTRLVDAEGRTIPFDPLEYETLELATQRLEALEAEHGPLDFARDELVEDVHTITAAFLIRHIDGAFAAWESVSEAERVAFEAFKQYVLPYRGSQEPIDDWLTPLRERRNEVRAALGGEASRDEVYRALKRAAKLRFNDRYYLHPTDQGYSEMIESGYGRCEDITNMETFVARAMAVATAADYTPAWAHRDNNHAWLVHLDRNGRGSEKSNAHAAKVYRKTYAIQRDALAFQLPEGRSAPNRFLQSDTYIDVTDQYAPTTDVTVEVGAVAEGHRFAYLCVFNGGRWVAIHWGRIGSGRVTFTDMGRGICYLPMVFDGDALQAAGQPLLVHANGTLQHLGGDGGRTDLIAVATGPKRKSPDTGVVTPVSRLKPGTPYVLERWGQDGFEVVATVEAGDGPMHFQALPSDALYRLIEPGSRSLERIFTIEGGAQRWW